LGLPWWVSIAASWGPGVAAILVRGPLRREGFRDSGIFRLGKGRGAAAAYMVALGLIPFVVAASTLLGISAGAFQVDWDAAQGLASPNLIVATVTDHFGLTGLLVSFVLIPLLPVIDLGEEIVW